jgi:hypothetical protein
MAGILKDWHTLQEKSMEPKPITAFEVQLHDADAWSGKSWMSVAVESDAEGKQYHLRWSGNTEGVLFTFDELEAVISLFTAARDAERKRTEVKT